MLGSVEDSPAFRRSSRGSLLTWALAAIAFGCGCSRPDAASAAPASAKSSPATVPLPSAPVLVASSASAAATPVSATAEPVAPAIVATAPIDRNGEDLKDPALRLFLVAACGPSGELPARFSRPLVDRHCARLDSVYDRYRKRWLSIAMPFFAELRPKELPHRVVYPFGGGDLVSALAVYPEAEEFTTLSLEPPGDVRKIDTVLPIRLQGALSVNGRNLGKLLGISYSSTLNLGRGERAALPGEIVLLLSALVVHGFEPTSLRYFRFENDGAIHYFSADEVASQGSLSHPAPEGAGAAFANVELGFHKAGIPGSDKVVRHIAQDLSNSEFGKNAGLRAYLESRGPVAVMTKAASHLLWADEFSTIRDYLLDHAVWMVSDSTGVPPRFAHAAGYVQDTYGVFTGPANFGPVEALDGKAFRHLFEENTHHPLPFKFGYGDKEHRSHLIVMHKAKLAAAPR
jgi:hypothetical protein